MVEDYPPIPLMTGHYKDYFVGIQGGDWSYNPLWDQELIGAEQEEDDVFSKLKTGSKVTGTAGKAVTTGAKYATKIGKTV